MEWKHSGKVQILPISKYSTWVYCMCSYGQPLWNSDNINKNFHFYEFLSIGKKYWSKVNVSVSVQFLTYCALTCLMHWISFWIACVINYVWVFFFKNVLNSNPLRSTSNNLYINTTWIRPHLTIYPKLANSHLSALGFTKEEISQRCQD